jgi:hypothetical protein
MLILCDVSLTFLYLLACHSFSSEKGEKWPSNLRCSQRTIQKYNLLQVVINTGLLTWAGWILFYKLEIWKSPLSYLPWEVPNMWLLNMSADVDRTILLAYHSTRYIDWMDTWILLSDNKPLSFLHVFHHGTMPLVTSLALRIGASVPGCLFGVVIWNALVHVILYTYYFFTRLNSPFGAWLRRHKGGITAVQILQFVVIAMQCGLAILFSDPLKESSPKSVYALELSYMMIMIVLFGHWSIINYKLKLFH